MKNMKFDISMWLLYIGGFFIVTTYTQYINEDSDIEIYDNLSLDYKTNDVKFDSENNNDFYIADEFVNPETTYNTPREKLISNKIMEKVYRYTKHRIPGYDYDEIEFINDKSLMHCDDKSIWTHCICQFTCNKPYTVDCYTPCYSGCECKENYVFDESIEECVYPEHCQKADEDNKNDVL